MFAFGSMKAKQEDLGPGTYCYKIHGAIYHTVNLAMRPDGGEKPSYAQLFFIDTQEALDFRKDLDPNKECEDDLMLEIDQLMRDINPYCEALNMMHEVEAQEYAKARNFGIDPPQIRLLFDVGANADLRCFLRKLIIKTFRRYNIPRTSEIAAVFALNSNDELPMYEGIAIHPVGRKLKLLSKFDKRAESMIYPLYFPTGKGGWNPRMLSNSGKRITLRDYYAYLLALRKDGQNRNCQNQNLEKIRFNPIHYGGKLFQQYLGKFIENVINFY